MPSVFDHPDPATAMRMAFEQPPPPPPDGVQAYASLRTVSGIGAPAVPRDGTGSFRPPTDPRLAQPAQPAATALDAGIAASDIQNAMLDDAGRGRQASTGLATPVPLPPLQADDGRDVGTPNDMTWAEMTTIEKVAPRELGTIAGKDVQTLVTDESRSFFDGTEMVRKGCREGGGVTYMPAMDILRLSAVPLSSAKKEAQPAALVAAGTCTFHDIVMAKTAPNVSAAPKICMDLKFVLLCETLRFGAFCTRGQFSDPSTNLEIVPRAQNELVVLILVIVLIWCFYLDVTKVITF